jgi:hypothetical protein
MAARHRRHAEDDPRPYGGLGTSWRDGDFAAVALGDKPRRRHAGRSAHRRGNGLLRAGQAEESSTGCNWVWKRGWDLDKTAGDRLAYYLKTRYIAIALASVALRMANFISSPIMIFILTAVAGGMSWVAEYVKSRIGSHGVSVTLGLRCTRWVVTPWFDATPR